MLKDHTNQGGADVLLNEIDELAKSMGVDQIAKGNDGDDDDMNKARPKDDGDDDKGDGDEGEKGDENRESDEEGERENPFGKSVSGLDILEALGDTSFKLEKALAGQDEVNLFNARAMRSLASVVVEQSKELGEVKKGLGEALDLLKALSGQPAAPVRSVRAVPAAGAIAKSFGTEGEGQEDHSAYKDGLFKAVCERKAPTTAMAHYDRTGTIQPEYLPIAKSYTTAS
jgi:hypothetical protein